MGKVCTIIMYHQIGYNRDPSNYSFLVTDIQQHNSNRKSINEQKYTNKTWLLKEKGFYIKATGKSHRMEPLSLKEKYPSMIGIYMQFMVCITTAMARKHINIQYFINKELRYTFNRNGKLLHIDLFKVYKLNFKSVYYSRFF